MTCRVVHVAQPVDAGVARCIADLTRDQVSRGWSVIVACPPRGRLPTWALEAGARLAAWDAERSPGHSTASEVRSLSRILRRADADVVHLHSSKAGLAGRVVLRGRRATVFQPHAWSWLAASGPSRGLALGWERAAARWTDVILCVSESERREGERARIATRWRVVPNGVDLTSTGLATDDVRLAVRAKLGLDERALVVCVGRLSRQKGQDVLLESWPRVLDSVAAAHLVLIGDGPERNNLERRGLENVELFGDRSDVPMWLAAADVVVVPSRWEGMSLGMLEAMAVGRSIVATDVGGVAETLGPGAGATVPVEDPASLAEAIVERLVDPQLRGSEERAARAVVERKRDLHASLDAIAGVYAEVIERRARAH
jgi:glycosyltransferase involved in cell wall biosynthesis